MAAVCVASVGEFFNARADEAVTGDHRIGVLKMLAARNEANFRKIETWQGTYRFIDRSRRRVDIPQVSGKAGGGNPGGAAPKREQRDAIMIREGAVDIALDVAADKLWTDLREDASKMQVFQPDTREAVKKPDDYLGYEQRTVVTPDSEIELRPNVKFGPISDAKDDPVALSGGTPGRLAERKAVGRTLKTNQTRAIVDPRHFYIEGQAFIWDNLNLNVDALLGNLGPDARSWGDQHTRITKSGVPGALEYRVTREFHSDPERDAIGLVTLVTTYSERDGFLPVDERTLARSGELNLARSWRYRQVDGILVPAEYRYTLNSFKDNKAARGAFLVLDRRLLLVEAKLNAALPEALFGAEGMKLERGDRLMDRIEQKLYVHDGRGIVPAETYLKSPGRKWRWLLCGNLVVLIAITAFLVWRRRFRRSRGA
jgi:hypothetical protein